MFVSSAGTTQTLWELTITWPTFKHSVRTAQATLSVSVMKIIQLMLYWKKIAVCSQISKKDINTLCGQFVEFLGAFVKLRKATISFVTSVFACPSARPQGTTRLQLDGFSWNFIFEHFFENLSKKSRVSSKSDKNNGYFIWRPIQWYLG